MVLLHTRCSDYARITRTARSSSLESRIRPYLLAYLTQGLILSEQQAPYVVSIHSTNYHSASRALQKHQPES